MIQYSPRPRSEYRWGPAATPLGPATSTLLDTPETWNLAYLSHDYDTSRDHPDPHFTTHVRRTAQFRLDGSGVDLVGAEFSRTVASLLRLPAPRFTYLIRQHRVLPSLPLFLAYGQRWLDIISERDRICLVDNYEMPAPNAASILAGSDFLKKLLAK